MQPFDPFRSQPILWEPPLAWFRNRQWLATELPVDLLDLTASCNMTVMHDENAVGLVKTCERKR